MKRRTIDAHTSKLSVSCYQRIIAEACEPRNWLRLERESESKSEIIIVMVYVVRMMIFPIFIFV